MDGVHLLRKRRHTRLWYRAMPADVHAPSALPTATCASGTDLLVHVAVAAEEAVWEEFFAESLPGPAPVVAALAETAPLLPESARQTRRLGPTHPAAKAPADPIAPPAAESEAEETWRIVPATAPSLLLSATDLLDARTPGPVLRPGCRYRVAGVQNGIVGLYVTDPDGKIGLGFCAAVDLICIDGRFQRYRAGRTTDVSNNPFRARMQRFTGGLSQATTSLLAAASNGSR
jgi:hypothetical protein